MDEDSTSDSSGSIVDDSQTKKEESNSWEEDSSDSSEGGEEVEIEDSDNEKDLNSRVNKPDVDSSSSSNYESNDSQEPKRKTTNANKKVWEDNPDVYGIRRSTRAKKEPQRLALLSDESDTDDVDFGKRRKKKKKTESWIPTLSETESEDTDSSFELPQRRKTNHVVRKRFGKRHNRRNNNSSSSDGFGPHRGARSSAFYKKEGSSRASSSKVSYKEESENDTDSDDLIEQDEEAVWKQQVADDVETIERVTKHREGIVGRTGSSTTVYAVKENPKPTELTNTNEPTELQFCIKWKNWSHLHNTWESKDTLAAQKCAGTKKLENYIKRMEEINRWKHVSSLEDVEYFECQQEMNEDIQAQYQQVERIIAHQFNTESASSYPDYLCKWQGLPYSDCSWEDGALTARYFQTHIDEYLERERADTIPNRNTKCLRHRPKFVPFKSQPKYIGGNNTLELRDYQLDGINWLAHAWCREVSCILSDEMGLGKTIQTISFLSYLFHTHSLYGPFIVVVPLSTMDAWSREFRLWGPSMNVIVYIGDVNSRNTIKEYEWSNKKTKRLKFNVLLTTYEMLLRDRDLLGSIYWACLMVDEAHRLKNDDSLLYRMLIDFRTNYRLLITGTPLQNSLKELWALMHFIMPNKFDSWEEFENQYSISEKEGLQKLHRDLEPYLLRRVKKDVEKSLPAKVEQILRVEMSQIQKQYYKLILTRNVKELCRELKGKFNGLLNIIVELKKCCNHANLIKPLELPHGDPTMLQTLIRGSGKMILLDKLLCRLKDTGHRVLIFSQMVRMLDIIADYMYLKRFQFQRLDGSIRGDQRKRALDHFNAEGSQDFCFLLSTRAGGLGINLASADTVIIFDSDWNPQNDLQAMARAHRIGQKNQVNIYRFVTKGSIEEDIIERAKKKMVLDHLIIQRMDTTGRRILSKPNAALSSANAPFNKEELSSILKFGAEELFKDHDHESDQKLQAMDIDDILQRAETQDTTDNSNSVGEELLSQFKVVNYAAFNEEELKTVHQTPMQKLWEEIIPEEDRKKMEEEMEREKRMADVTLKPRNRKAVEKMNIGLPDKKTKSKEIVESDTSSNSDSVMNEDAVDVKGKKMKKATKVFTKDGIKGFTDTEIRRFIKSYKKFSCPLSRLDAIAQDAELTDKATGKLKELGELLKTSCEQAVKDYQDKLQQDEKFDGRKKGATLKIAGVNVNAPSILKAESDLEPLATCLPNTTKQQKSYRLTTPTRNVHWGVSWGVVEDSMLLVGMLLHGVGNWDAIKADSALMLGSKILPIGNGKPQNKHLQSRAEYLLKLLKEQRTQKAQQASKKKKGRGQKRKRKRVDEDVELDEKPVRKTTSTRSRTKEANAKKKKKEKQTNVTVPLEGAQGEHQVSYVISEVIDMKDELFKKCKEKMRPEKKSLQLLHTPDDSLPQEEQVNNTKRCLLRIGDHIETCLNDYHDNTSEQDVWRSNLWSFVAKFTELSPCKLFKLYRTACRKRDVQRDEEQKEIEKMKSSHTSSLHEIGKHIPPDRLQLEEARKKALGIDSNLPAGKIDKMKIPHKKRQKLDTMATAYNSKNTSKGRQRKAGNRDHSTRSQQSRQLADNSAFLDEKPQNSEVHFTFRDWKEAQKKKQMDEKPPTTQKPLETNLSMNRPRYSKDKPGSSPLHKKSPTTSPLYSGEKRVRTFSHDSDSSSSLPSDKKSFQDSNT